MSLAARGYQVAGAKVSVTYPLINFNLQIFFEDALDWQHRLSRAGASVPFGNYYEFGVFRGDTIVTFYRALERFQKKTGLWA